MAGELVSVKQKLQTFRGLLDRQLPEIQKAVPKHIDPGRMVRAILTVFARTPKLLDCTPASVMGAVMQAANYGLELDPNMGQAYLVPYKTTCQLIIGYQGMITMALRVREVKSVVARCVYEKDYFEHELGLDEVLIHKPHRGEDRGALVAVYAVAKLQSDGDREPTPIFEVMWRDQVDAIRKRSRASGDGPWVTDYDAMARKTVIRRIAKFLPKSSELAAVVDREERFERGDDLDTDGIVDEVLQEQPALEGQAVAGVLPAAQPSALDELAGKLTQGQPEPEKVAPAASSAAAPASQAAPPVVHDPRPAAPPSPTARDTARAAQASRHEVPRAHKADRASTAPEITDKDIPFGLGEGREPGAEG